MRSPVGQVVIPEAAANPFPFAGPTLTPSSMSDYLTTLLEVPRKFVKDSQQLLQRCTKPDKRGMSPLPPPSSPLIGTASWE